MEAGGFFRNEELIAEAKRVEDPVSISIGARFAGTLRKVVGGNFTIVSAFRRLWS